MRNHDIRILWPPERVLGCPMCHHPIPGDEPDDPGLFRCRGCGIPVFTKILNGDLKLMIATGSFLFDPQSWVQMGRSPWSGELMSAVSIDDSRMSLTGCRIEPDFPGRRLILIVTHDHTVYAFQQDGRVTSIDARLEVDAQAASRWLRWDGYAHWNYSQGVVLDGVLWGKTFYLQHQMPLTSFLRGGENIAQAASHNAINLLTQELTMHMTQVMPYADIGNNWLEQGDRDLDKFCTLWGVEQVVVKDWSYFWRFGTSRAWMIHKGDEL